MWVRSLGLEDPLEEVMATHYSILTLFSRSVVSGSLQPHGLQHASPHGFPVLHHLLELAQTHVH